MISRPELRGSLARAIWAAGFGDLVSSYEWEEVCQQLPMQQADAVLRAIAEAGYMVVPGPADDGTGTADAPQGARDGTESSLPSVDRA